MMINIYDKIKKIYLDRKNLYIFLVVGIIILISSNIFFSSDAGKKEEQSTNLISISVAEEEQKLEDILSQVDGAGKTEVMITLDTGVEKITIQNSKISKSDSSDIEETGGETKAADSSEERQTVMNGSGNSQTPFVVKEIYPQIRGVLVVAEGAGDESIRYNLTNAVAAVLNVPYYRIQVLKKSN